MGKTVTPPSRSQQGSFHARVVQGAGNQRIHSGKKDIGYGSNNMANATRTKGKK